MNFEPIGTYHSEAKAPYEAARQPLDRISTQGEIVLQSGQQFEQALENLEGFERIWVVYVFHHNTTHWKPKVLPPRGSDQKVGVFATRAPYRPNPIGMSCVKLVKINGLRLTIEGADLLDGTPVLDIKPYLPYADAFPESKIGWLENVKNYAVSFSETAKKQISFLQAKGLSQLQDFILNQLEYDPINSDKKRVSADGSNYVLAYKTWRVRFQLNADNVSVLDLFSGYSKTDLESSEDPYKDKDLHREFLRSF
ncbi:tRNA (N6-threonylcarbamoyladenosine(37)-N6)-methyltransferase TrmO [Bdellovibrio sp. HCB337]|uniref:tRNA (N6-threonylcarbamoyladenosine(37)-N6)-methyltransferase TrmO n=1 Tax=Bdellovibrio sp. HCB337 TaxID=3394358 RepID=UPI0039A75011